MLKPSTLILLLVNSISVNSKEGHGWNYKLEDDHSGPLHWSSTYGDCSGNRQSPLDLTGAKDAQFPSLGFKNYHLKPAEAILRNNGHTAKLSTNPTKPELIPIMSGGGLPHDYKFSQVHFHWGSDNNKGSEHLIDGTAFPMEMHFVHYKASHETIVEAVTEGAKDSLAVLGIFFQLDQSPNPGLSEMMASLEKMFQAGNITEVPPFPISNLWERDGDFTSFYRYEGSLTTPSCNEIVQWTLLKKPVMISQDQLDMFRSLLTTEKGKLVDNFRPVQDLGEREILDVLALDMLRSGHQKSESNVVGDKSGVSSVRLNMIWSSWIMVLAYLFC